jgi:hypothetical protein
MHGSIKFLRFIIPLLALFTVAGLLAACAAQMTEAPFAGESKTDVEKEVEVQFTPAVQEPAAEVQESGAPSPTPAPPLAEPTPTVQVEARLVELEWPRRLRLGDSDVVRLSLIPSEDGYTVRTDFPEHATDLQPLQINRPGGFDLYAAARLEGVGFVISPSGEQAQYLPPDETLTWHWSLQPRLAGQQRLALILSLRWVPSPGQAGLVRQNVIYSRGLDVQVASFFGLTRAQAMTGGIFGLLLGGGLFLLGLVLPGSSSVRPTRGVVPNPRLVIEPQPGLALSAAEETLLRLLFNRYARLVLDREFLSGYSGARTFLVRPVRADGRADAAAIVKMGQPAAVQGEFDNYERFVKDTLPPITARIQHPPVTVKEAGLGAIQYTFIGAPGDVPLSLRLALLQDPDPAYLDKMFATFGPNWWMQRKPYTFRLAQEYDRLLPTHLILEPAPGHGLSIDSQTPPETLDLKLGDLVTLRDFSSIERRPDGRSQSLHGQALHGQPELRLRWLSLSDPRRLTGRVVATRESQLRDFSLGFDDFGFPDPISRLPDLLSRTVSGSQSTIHGDLNLENILVGPGGLVWLIDFAQTRDGHTLFDFAHLGAEIIAHVIAPQLSPEAYFEILLSGPFTGEVTASGGLADLLSGLYRIAGQCLFNPSQPQEFHLALYLACLGALKYSNLDVDQKHLLYLTAAYLCGGL